MRGRAMAALAMAALGMSGCWLQPRLDPGRTNANTGEQELTAANVAGLAELWSTEISTPEVPPAAILAPLALEGNVYAAQDGGLVAAVDAASGHRHWATDLGVEVPPDFPLSIDDPAYHEGRVVVPWGSYRSGGTVSFDPATGAEVARTGGGFPGAAVSDLAVVGDALVFKSFALLPPTTAVTAVNGQPFVPAVARNGTVGADYAFVGDSIAWTDPANATGYHPDCQRISGTNYCMPSWTTDLGAAPGSPTALGDDAVVYADASGTVSVLDMATGAISWQAELGAASVGQATVAGGAILVATADGRLVALPAEGCGAATCTAEWEGAVGGTPSANVTVGGDVAYVGTTSGAVAAFGLAGCGEATCEPLTTVSAGSPITGGPIVHDGRVLAGTEDGRLVAFGLPD